MEAIEFLQAEYNRLIRGRRDADGVLYVSLGLYRAVIQQYQENLNILWHRRAGNMISFRGIELQPFSDSDAWIVFDFVSRIIEQPFRLNNNTETVYDVDFT
jgi:hypothetical protein